VFFGPSHPHKKINFPKIVAGYVPALSLPYLINSGVAGKNSGEQVGCDHVAYGEHENESQVAVWRNG